MKRILHLYQYIAPVVLFPIGYYLWLSVSGSPGFAAYAMALPVITAYIIPGIGTNVLKLWEINTRFRIGRFRPHHGFVFGSATAVLTFLCSGGILCGKGLGAALSAGFILASVLGFWNWLYDIIAIRADIIRVYNKPHYYGQGAEAVATDYAPAYFGMFGFVYGIALNTGYQQIHQVGANSGLWILFALFQLISITAPVLFFMVCSKLQHGYWGINPYSHHKETNK